VHLACAGLRDVPAGEWACAACAALRAPPAPPTDMARLDAGLLYLARIDAIWWDERVRDYSFRARWYHTPPARGATRWWARGAALREVCLGTRADADAAPVSAVVRRLIALGWLSEARKTARQAVFTVAAAGASAGAKDLPPELQSPPIVGQGGFQSEDATQPRMGTGLDQETETTTTASSAARALVEKHRDRLACKGTTNPAGAWFRHLRARLSWWADSVAVEEEARALDAAIVAMSARAGAAWLHEGNLTRFTHRAGRA
jgi:hypothetical protein